VRAYSGVMDAPRATTRRHLPTSPFKDPVPPPLKVFAPGDRVTHDREGMGRVVSTEEGVAVLVDFGTVQLRIAAPYPNLYLL
jgi:hypothetical protein